METKEQIEANIEVLDKLDTYQIIADEKELRWFFDHVIRKPEIYESYAFCLSHRSKKLTKEERENFRAKESEMLDPQVVFPHRDGSFEFQDWVKGIYRYETNKRAYALFEGHPLFAKAMVLYCTPNPSDEVDVVKSLKKYISLSEDEFQCAARKHSDKGMSEALYHLCRSLTKFKRLQFDSVGTKYWVDFDMDIKEPLAREMLYEFTYKEFESRFGKGSFVFVETNGGFHILLDKSKLKQNPNDIINTVMKYCFPLSGEIGKKLNANYSFGSQLIDEFKYNNNKDKENKEARNCMLPTPGTYQYGNIVRVRNKDDFE